MKCQCCRRKCLCSFIDDFHVCLKINESQYIALFVVCGTIKKLFSIDCVNIYFSQSIVNYLFSIGLKVWGYPTLLISWFINFKLFFFAKKSRPRMECLCCGQIFTDQSSLKDHYLTSHNADQNNHFLKKIFTRGVAFVPRKCFWCSYFCMDRRDEKAHNFISHYQLDGRQPVEDKPLQKPFLTKICRGIA